MFTQTQRTKPALNAFAITLEARIPLDDRPDPGQIADQRLERRVPCADLPKYARRSLGRVQTCSVSDAPRYRLWPPIDVGVPLVLGLTLTATLGDPVSLPHWLGPFGWLLVAAFALWNGWALVLMAKNRTAVLPGGPTRTVLDRGPFRVSRNPLYLGLLALHAGIALLWPSFWALVAVPVSAGLLLWGAIVPEEQYLKVKFGAEYERYAARVRRWL